MLRLASRSVFSLSLSFRRRVSSGRCMFSLRALFAILNNIKPAPTSLDIFVLISRRGFIRTIQTDTQQNTSRTHNHQLIAQGKQVRGARKLPKMLWIYGCLLLILTTCAFSHDYDEDYGVSEDKNNVFYPRFGQVCELFSTKKEVKNLVVPISGYTAESLRDLNSHPSIYFNLHKNSKNLGQYVLINKTLHKINDGRDSTADYPPEHEGEDVNKNIYIGAADGIYVYDPDTRAVEKYGDINEDIIAIEKVTGKDEIYILNTNHKIYKITEGGNVKTPVEAIDYARDFTLDLNGGIFYIDRVNKPKYLATEAKEPFIYNGVGDQFKNYIISRAMWSQHDGVNHIIPYIADGVSLHFARGNFTWANHDVNLITGLTAFNAELLSINYYGVNGKIYEHNLILESETSYNLRAGAMKANKTHQQLKAFDQDVKANYDNVNKMITN